MNTKEIKSIKKEREPTSQLTWGYSYRDLVLYNYILSCFGCCSSVKGYLTANVSGKEPVFSYPHIGAPFHSSKVWSHCGRWAFWGLATCSQWNSGSRLLPRHGGASQKLLHQQAHWGMHSSAQRLARKEKSQKWRERDSLINYNRSTNIFFMWYFYLFISVTTNGPKNHPEINT